MTDALSIEIEGLKEWQRKQEQVVRDLSGSPMENAMRDATLLVLRSAKMLAPVNTGRLRASITPDVRSRGREVRGVVGSNVEYAPFMELGTKPHYPPLAPILRWVQLKFKLGPKGGYAIAKGVQRAIGLRGLKARKFLQGAVEENEAKIAKILERGVGRIVDK